MGRTDYYEGTGFKQGWASLEFCESISAGLHQMDTPLTLASRYHASNFKQILLPAHDEGILLKPRIVDGNSLNVPSLVVASDKS